jgi:hypothetical protein
MQKATSDYEALRASLQQVGSLEELRSLAEAGNSACDSGCDGGCGSELALGEALVTNVKDARAGRLSGVYEARKLQGLEILQRPGELLEAGNDACDSGCDTGCSPSEILGSVSRPA